MLTDDLERQILVALRSQDITEALDVGDRELPVPGRGPLRLYQTFRLQEADLGDADLRKIRLELSDDLADAEPAAARGHRHLAPAGVAVEVDQPVLADLDLVAAGQQDLVYAVPVDVGAVETSDVGDQITVGRAAKHRVPPAHRDVVKEDVAVGVAPRGDLLGVQQEPAA